MTSQRPTIVTGEVVPGVINPNIRRSFVTNTPYGPPIKEPVVKSTPMAPQGTQPRPTGDDRGGMASILQKVMQQQQQGGGGAQQALLTPSLPPR